MSVVAGIMLGNYVDSWLETESPWFTMLGLLAGVVAGFSLLLRMLKKIK